MHPLLLPVPNEQPRLIENTDFFERLGRFLVDLLSLPLHQESHVKSQSLNQTAMQKHFDVDPPSS
jgi:hypothetical protein